MKLENTRVQAATSLRRFIKHRQYTTRDLLLTLGVHNFRSKKLLSLEVFFFSVGHENEKKGGNK